MMERIIEKTRYLRKNQTPSERILWQMLRDRKFAGKKFDRQYAIKVDYQGQIRFFIADFYCHEKRLVIEMDGKIHENQKEHDEYRTFVINQLGIRVFRLKNEELNDIANVAAKIKAFL